MSLGALNVAAESYSAAIFHLTAQLGAQWEVVDWSDPPLAWRFFRARGVSLPQQGWKIHISGSACEGVRLLSAIRPTLAEFGASFKVLRRVEQIVYLNSGDAGERQLGKVLTVYPRDSDEARRLIQELDAAWPTSTGPEVTTDLHVRPGSAVSFRYGVFGPAPILTTSTGTHHYALLTLDGRRIPDIPSADGLPSAGCPEAPLPGIPASPLPVRLKEPISVGGRGYTPLHRMSATARAAIFLGVETAALTTVAIKVGRKGVGGDLDGRDISHQLAQEFENLRTLDKESVSPAALGWSLEPWPTLVMEDIRGPRLSDLPYADRIASLPRLADVLVRLHRAGFVHGDVKLDNAIRAAEGLRLLDFEFAARAGEPMRRGGTLGHMAPEVDGETVAHGSRDVFALGGCVFQAVLGIPPGILPAGPGRQVALLRNEGRAAAARLVAALTAADPLDRPATEEAAEMLGRLADDVSPMPRREPVVPRSKLRSASERLTRWSRRAAVQAGVHVASFARTDGAGTCWRNLHAMRQFDCEAINVGAAGILLGLMSLDTALGRRDFDVPVERGARWLADRPAAGQAAGLYTGNAGVALALSVAGCRLHRADLLIAARGRFEAAAADHRELDLFSGSSGVIWTACLLHDILGENWPLELARPALDHLVAQALTSEEILFWTPDADRDPLFLGCAHGSAGTALALSGLGGRIGEPRLVDVAIQAFRGIRARGRSADGEALRIDMRRPDHHAPGSWCHGIAGYLWCILQGPGDDPRLREEIDWAVDRLESCPVVGTPTYCHGLAGQLELWRMLREIPRFRALAGRRADRAARALRSTHQKVDGLCVWTAEDPEVITPDLWVGFLGPATALALYAEQYAMPLLSSQWLSRCATCPSNRSNRPSPVPYSFAG